MLPSHRAIPAVVSFPVVSRDCSHPWRRARLLASALVLVSFIAPAAAFGQGGAGDVAISFVPSATQLPGCPGSELEVIVRLSNPSALSVGGYQVFLRFPAESFEAVRYEALAVKGQVTVEGPFPLGGGFGGCGTAAPDGWSDRAGQDVVAVIGTVFGGGDTQPFRGTSVDLGRLTFRPLGVPTAGAAPFSSNVEPCHAEFDRQTRVFDPAGRTLAMAQPQGFSVTLTEGGPSVSSFTCTDSGSRVVLTWASPSTGNYTGYRFYRNSVVLETLPLKMITSYEDASPPAGSVTYEIAVLLPGGAEGCRDRCTVVRGGGASFRRGDANQDGTVNISDPVAVLNHLFRGQPVTCLDAADFDDTGVVNITDAVFGLRFLFVAENKVPPPPPHPDPGPDPTPDALTCPG